MLSLRSPRRSPLLRVMARVLILALVTTLVPLESSAFIPTRTEKLTKSAFGELLAHTGTDPQPYAFTGEPLDPNSRSQYHRARWMDPGVGRFVSLDPLLGALSLTESEDPDLIGLRPYLYVQSDPVNRVDPSGLADFTLVGITITITNQNTIRAQNTVYATAARSTILRQLGSVPVKNVNGMRAIRQAGQQTHHLIERRIYERIPQLKKIWPRHDQMPGVNLTPAQHQQFTNLWRQFFPYRNQSGHIANPTLDDVIAAAEKIYTGRPELFKGIFVDLLLLL